MVGTLRTAGAVLTPYRAPIYGMSECNVQERRAVVYALVEHIL
jgi:hypothetical protein